MDKSLTVDEILKIAGLKNFNKIENVIHSQNKRTMIHKILNQLTNKSNIIQELMPHKNIEHYLIHYETGNQGVYKKGHWTCLIIDNIRKIALFFDSLGLFPDNELKQIPYDIRENTDQLDRHIGRLLFSLTGIGYKIYYNSIKFQKDEAQTCGRFCGLLFAVSKNKIVQPEQFKKLLDKFSQVGDYDTIAIELSS